jgi:hypothetical protein
MIIILAGTSAVPVPGGGDLAKDGEKNKYKNINESK